MNRLKPKKASIEHDKAVVEVNAANNRQKMGELNEEIVFLCAQYDDIMSSMKEVENLKGENIKRIREKSSSCYIHIAKLTHTSILTST